MDGVGKIISTTGARMITATKLEPCIDAVSKQYFRWVGHAAEATSSMLSTTVTADLHRRQGRPATHWLSPIEAFHRSRGAPRNHPWHACALDRDLWASWTNDFLDFIHSERAPAELRWSMVMDELG